MKRLHAVYAILLLVVAGCGGSSTGDGTPVDKTKIPTDSRIKSVTPSVVTISETDDRHTQRKFIVCASDTAGVQLRMDNRDIYPLVWGEIGLGTTSSVYASSRKSVEGNGQADRDASNDVCAVIFIGTDTLYNHTKSVGGAIPVMSLNVNGTNIPMGPTVPTITVTVTP